MEQDHILARQKDGSGTGVSAQASRL